MTVYVKQNSLIVNTYFLLVLRFVFQEHGGFTWRESDLLRISGVYLQVMIVRLKRDMRTMILV